VLDFAKVIAAVFAILAVLSTPTLTVLEKIIAMREKSDQINGRFVRNMVYVQDKDFDFVYNFISRHCPQAEIK
jgi:hypothetical protein